MTSVLGPPKSAPYNRAIVLSDSPFTLFTLYMCIDVDKIMLMILRVLYKNCKHAYFVGRAVPG